MFVTPHLFFKPARITRKAVAICLALAPWAAMALDMGTLHWKPATGVAPFAEIDLNDQNPIDVSTIRVSVATREAYGVAGLTYHPGLASTRISAQAMGAGRVALRLEQLPLNVPALDLLVVLNNRDKLILSEYRINPQLGPHDVAPAPVGTRQAALARQADGKKTTSPVSSTPTQTEDSMTTPRTAVLAWAQAWSRRDVDAYIGAYTPDYAGPKAKSTHQAWVDERRKRIASRKEISVKLSKLQLKRQGDTVTVTFVQSYRSDGPTDRMRKQLVLVQSDGRWLIQNEIPLK